MMQLIFEEVLVGLVLWLIVGPARQQPLNTMVPMELLRYVKTCAKHTGALALVFLSLNAAVAAWVPLRADGLSSLAYAGCCLIMLGLGVVVALILHNVITLARYTRMRLHANREHHATARRATTMPEANWTAAELAALPSIDAPRWKPAKGIDR